MEIKTIVEDGVHVFAMVGRDNLRRRYRMQRGTGAVNSFVPDGEGNWHWRQLRPGMAAKVRRAITKHCSVWVGDRQPAQWPLEFSR